MYSFILFKFKDNELISCDYLTSKEITAKNYNFDEDKITLERFSSFVRPLIKNKTLYLSNLNIKNETLYKIYANLINKEYQKVSILDKEDKSIKVFKIPNYELEIIKKYSTVNKKIINNKIPKKKGKINRLNLFGRKQVVITSLSTILLLSSNIANNKINNNSQNSNEENIVETQEEVLNTNEIKNIIDQIKDISQSYKNDNTLSISVDDATKSEKAIYCYENYYKLIEKYANTYGIDPNLAYAIACHERGYHSNEVDSGGGLGLFQIQIEGSWNWDNKEISAFNFDTNSIETYLIKKENIRNLEDNIKVGLMLFQNCLQRNDYNVAKAVSEYNYGSTYLDKTINDACYYLGKDSSYFDNLSHLEWLDYRNYGGDPNYLENVFKYIENGKILSFKKPNGEKKMVMFENKSLNLSSTNKTR